MKKSICRNFTFLLILFQICTGCAQPNSITPPTEKKQSPSPLLRVVDVAAEDVLPENFRMCSDPVPKKKNPMPNLEGLSSINASASAQFSEAGLQKVKDSIGNTLPILIVDLRQECHGFLNGMAISWYANHNTDNIHLTRNEVIANEKFKVQNLKQQQSIIFDEVPGKTVEHVPFIGEIKTVRTEEELVKASGMSYLRIPVTDRHAPSDEEVDYFLRALKTFPSNYWIHFHCREGKGRATTFIAMYDMMKNAKKVSLEDIVERQYLLGVINLLEYKEKGFPKETAEQRAKFIEEFYKYCSTNSDNFKTPWSEWKEAKTFK